MDKKILKKYTYLVCPTPYYFHNTKYNSPKDISSVPENLRKGLEMYGCPEAYGTYSDDEHFEEDNFRLMRYLEKKYNIYKYKDRGIYTPGEDIPLYVMKIPTLYMGTMKDAPKEYLPLPYLEKYTSSEYSTNGYDTNWKNPLFNGLFRMHPQTMYGVYSRDFGGFIKNPSWSPVFDPRGYVFDRPAWARLRQLGEGNTYVDLIKYCKDKNEVLAMQDKKGGEIFQKTKTKDVLARYEDLFAEDIPTETKPITNEEVYNRFNLHWDVTSGLVPHHQYLNDRIL